MPKLITKNHKLKYLFLLLLVLIITGCESDEYMLESRETILDKSEFKRVSRTYALQSTCGPFSHYLNGEVELYACNLDSKECYSVNAEIVNSVVKSIQFNDGKTLIITDTMSDTEPYLDMHGEGEGYDSRNSNWSFEADTKSALYENAIQKWAQEHDYVIE